MRILIIGASGLIGSHLMHEAAARSWTVTGTYLTHAMPGLVPLDMNDSAAVADCLTTVRPDVVIAPAAQPNVDYCETHPTETRRVNVDGVATLIRETAGRGLSFVYFSSDYVFDGERGPYTENDPVHPLSEYARQKVACEELLEADHPHPLIIRTTGVYGWEPQQKNFVASLIRRLTAGETVPVPNDQFGSPTDASDCARAVCTLVERGARGVFHVAGPEVMSRFAFAQCIAATFGLDASHIQAVATETLHQAARRPLRAGLRIEKLEQETGVGMRPAAQALEELKPAYGLA